MNSLNLLKANPNNTDLQLPASCNIPVLDLDAILQELNTWRSSKKSKFDPMPDTIKFHIFQALLTNNYKVSYISKKLHLAISQIKAIKTFFANNKANAQDELALLPFKLIPHNPAHNQYCVADSQISSPKDIQPPLHNQCPSNSTSGITLRKADGSYISLPSSLSDSLVASLVTSFLCCK